MEITWFGQALFKLKGKNATVVVDPYDGDFVGLKLPKDLAADVVMVTHGHQDHNNLTAVTGDPVQIMGPGDYEVKGVAITGTQTFHDNKKGEERGKNTAYTIQLDNLNVVHLGDLGQTLTEEQTEEIGAVDILLIPVGGNYTIDSKVASEVVAALEPRIIIPMHYALPGLKFELDPVEKFLKEMGVENVEPQPKLVITKDKLPDEPQVVVLSKA